MYFCRADGREKDDGTKARLGDGMIVCAHALFVELCAVYDVATAMVAIAGKSSGIYCPSPSV